MNLKDFEYYRTDNGILYCGDCLDIMPMLEPVDMILVDPPYGTTACKWDSIIPLESMWKQVKRLIKKGGAIVITASQPFTSILISSNLEMFKYCWVWKKSKSSNFLQSNYQPRKIHEDIVVFSNGYASYTTNGGKMSYNPQMWGKAISVNSGELAKNALNSWNGRQRNDYNIISTNKTGKKFPESVVEFKNDMSKLHPTQKPAALMEYLIKTYTNEKEIVLDFAAGSGTTGIACEQLNRKWIMIEKEKEYCQIIKERIKNELQQNKLPGF